jgi:hypothetical protein
MTRRATGGAVSKWSCRQEPSRTILPSYGGTRRADQIGMRHLLLVVLVGCVPPATGGAYYSQPTYQPTYQPAAYAETAPAESNETVTKQVSGPDESMAFGGTQTTVIEEHSTSVRDNRSEHRGRHHKRHKKSRGPRVSISAIEQACGDSMYTDQQKRQCFELASRAMVDPVPGIRACSDIMYTYEQKLQCIGSIEEAAYEPSAAMRACSDAMYTYEQKQQCISSVVSKDEDFTDVVTACSGAMYTYEQKLQCVSDADASGRDPVEMVGYCSRNAYSYEDKLSCLTR